MLWTYERREGSWNFFFFLALSGEISWQPQRQSVTEINHPRPTFNAERNSASHLRGETDIAAFQCDIWAHPGTQFSRARSASEQGSEQFALPRSPGFKLWLIFFFLFFFFFFKSLLGSSAGSHLHRLACGAATFTLPRTPKTPRGCHVPLSLRGEMISIGLLLMRLAGSLAGERWFQVCMSESLPACRCAARHNASASVQKRLSTNPGEGGSGTL